MRKALPKFCKDAKALCGALGIKLPAQRKRATKLTSLVLGWARGEHLPAGCPAFPAKSSKGWPFVPVVEWAVAAGLVNTGKDKWELKPGKHRTSNIEHPTSRGGGEKQKAEIEKQKLDGGNQEELPVARHPSRSVDDFFAGMSAQEMRKGRFDRLQDMYLRPEAYETKIAKFEIEELKQERPWLFERDSGNGSENISGGTRGVAMWIRQTFPGLGIGIHQKRIVAWMHGEDLPPGCREPFPQYAESGRYKTEEVRAWCEKYLRVPEAHQALPFEPMAEEERHAHEKRQQEKWEWEQERRRDDNNFIRRDVVLALVDTFFRTMYGCVDATEKTQPKIWNERVERIKAESRKQKAEMDGAGETSNIQHPTSNIELWQRIKDEYRSQLIAGNEALKLEMQRAVAGLKERNAG